jgi:23S rRNA (cytidine1920-2'-O)/16S rRNA (cytidine1409-2'-O)-methyltransferase
VVRGEVRRRLDDEMVRRGLTATRSEATLAIRARRVVVGGSPAVKAATLVRPDEPIALTGAPRRYVSRGGEKLEAALDRFGIDVEGARALDAGASTGGFTDCLLSRGAAHVVAVDVGYGQLDWRLREDPRVTVFERVNARDLDPGSLPYAPELITADLSFISLRLVLPALVRCASGHALFVLLVKPQFEAGKEDVGGGGVVRDPEVWRRVLSDVAEASRREGLEVVGVMASPLLGPAGNVEFFLHARGPEAALNEGSGPDVDAAVDEARALVGQPGRRSDREEGTGGA